MDRTPVTAGTNRFLNKRRKRLVTRSDPGPRGRLDVFQIPMF